MAIGTIIEDFEPIETQNIITDFQPVSSQPPTETFQPISEIPEDPGLFGNLKAYRRWLELPTHPKSFYDWATRTIPKDVSRTAIMVAEFPYVAVKTVTDPMLEFGKDVLMRDVDIEESAKGRGIEMGKGAWDLLHGFGHWMGQYIGLYPPLGTLKERIEVTKEAWKEKPVGGVLAVSPFLKARAMRQIKGRIIEEDALIMEELGRKPGLFRRAYEKVDLMAPFDRISAHNLGLAVKGFPSIKIAEANRFLQYADKIKKLKLNEIEGYQAYLKSANAIKEPLDPRIEKAASLMEKYFDEAGTRLIISKALKHRWPEGLIIRNNKKIAEITETLENLSKKSKKRIALEKQLNELRAVNEKIKAVQPKYAHIPLDFWFRKIRKSIGEENASNLINVKLSSLYKGRFFRERKTIDVKELTDWLRELKDEKGNLIFSDIDFDIRIIGAQYAQKVGTIRALANIFNQAKQSKVLKLKTQKKIAGYGEFPLELKLRYPELNNYYGHNAFIEYMENHLRRVDKSATLGRVFGYTKMLAFYNPFFLPAYDIWQATWLGSVSPLHPLRTAKYLYQGFRDTFTKTERFYEAQENVAFSTPYVPRFDEFMNKMKSSMPRSMQKQLRKMEDLSIKIPVMDDFYRLVWNMAWKGDNAIRMASYNFLRDKGLTAREAGEMTATMHADYARLTPKARTILNKIIFTPTFKYVMGQAQANMIKSSAKIMIDAMRLKRPQARDVMFAKGALGLTAGLLAQEYLLRHWGFKTDEFGLRYYKEVTDEKGKKKELVVYVPNPNNVILRMVHKFSDWGAEPDKMDEIINKVHWYLHPLYATSVELAKNRGIDGSPVYDPNDNPDIIARNIAHYAVRRIVGAESAIEDLFIREKSRQKDANKALSDEIGRIWEYFLRPVTFRYLREPKDKRTARHMKELKDIFKKYQYIKKFYGEKVSDERLRQRRENFFKKLKDLQEKMDKE